MSAITTSGIRGMDKLQTQLRAYPRFVQEQNTKLLQKHARSLISSTGENKGLIQIIPPASMDRGVFGAAAKKQGEGKVMADIWKVYGTPSNIYARLKSLKPYEAAGYWKAVKAKGWTLANRIAQRNGLPRVVDFTEDDGAEHRKRRGRNGRVRGKDKTLFVTDGRYVRTYIRMKQRNVGLLAAALVNGYDGRFGSLRGVPAWISRHSGSWGSASITEMPSPTAPRVRIALEAGALNGDLQRWFNAALKFRLAVMQREAPVALRAAAKAAGLLR